VVALVVGSMVLSVAHFVNGQNVQPSKAISAPARDDFDPNHIISRFTAVETESLEEFGRYGYKLEFIVQALKKGKVVDEYRRVSQMLVNKSGKIEEKVLGFTKPSGDILVTREDLDNLAGSYQFALQTSNANQYRFAYVAKEQISGLDFYVFDVTPISIPPKRRLFRGRIWVGVDSLRIVKTLGKFEQKGQQKFPVIEMYRAAIDNRWLFPVVGSGDDELVFENGQSQHLRFIIKYTDFVKLR
jgi:hypothetical protein